MTGIRRLCGASLRRYFVLLFVAGPALGTYGLQADQPAPPLGDIMNSTPHAMDGSCEPAFRGGPCGDCCMDLWRGYCQEKPHGYPISPRRYADVASRPCPCQRCPSVRPSAPCAPSQPQPVASPVLQPAVTPAVPANPPAPAVIPATPAPSVSSSNPTNETIETSSPAWESASPSNEPTPAAPLAEPPLPKNVLPPQEVLEDEAPAAENAPQASHSRGFVPVAPEPRPLSIRPASAELNRGTARLVRQLKTIR